MKQKVRDLCRKVVTNQVDGVGVIEVILILVIIIGLVLIFRNQIGTIIQNAFASIKGDVGGISSDIVVN